MNDSFKFNPLDSNNFFEKFEGTAKVHINRRIEQLSTDKLVQAVEHYEQYLRTGNWPVTGTVMHELYEEYYTSDDCPEWDGIQTIYTLICHEIARKWIKEELQEPYNRK